MKTLDSAQFQDRIEAVLRSQHIFIPHLTTNITVAFHLYQEVLAEQQRKVIINTLTAGHNAPNLIDQLGRLTCFKCETPMALRQITNGKYNTQWECPRCGKTRRSKKTVQDWIDWLTDRFWKTATD